MGARLSYPAVDLSGKVAIVTGANTGIGYETAKALVGMGARTVIACRSEEKAVEAMRRMKGEIHSEFPEKTISMDFLPLDLSSFHATKEFVTAFRAKNLPLHLLINNAGVYSDQGRNSDGYEVNMQVNHLSPFLLTLELLPSLMETADSSGDCRVVFVASIAHQRGVWAPQNRNAEKSFDKHLFYGNSKLYNVMTAYALQRKLTDVGITVSSLHPGVISSDLWRTSPLIRLAKPMMRGTVAGAATTINCAVNPELNSCKAYYYSDCKPAPATTTARNERLQEELWSYSVEQVRPYLSPHVLGRWDPTHQPDETSRPHSEEEGEETTQADTN